LEAAFQAFTRKTGIEVKILNRSTCEMFERLKAEGDKTPADDQLTVDAGNLWNAARAGLLAKVDSPELIANIPANLRDPESRWFGLTVRARTIMYSTPRSSPPSCRPTRPSAIPNGRGGSACGSRATSTTSRSSPP
jgi:iron(III) transport system substrate-binding protein